MIKFFRRIRQQLLFHNKFSKYLLYGIGEIALVVIGIIIAVGVGEWRQSIKVNDEMILVYKGLKKNLKNDKLLLDSLSAKYENAINGIEEEINKLQLVSYNQDSLYSNVPTWMMYSQVFTPNKSTITEMTSSGKLHLITNLELKDKILVCYDEEYTRFIFRQNTLNEYTRELRTSKLMSTYRLVDIFTNDGNENTDILFSGPKYNIKHHWIDDKHSDNYLLFENYLAVIRGGYLDNLNGINKLKPIVNELILMIDLELEKETND